MHSFPASRGPFSFVFAELTDGTKSDLCHGSKLPLQGGDRSEAWDRETMFSQLAKRSSQNVDSGVCHNKYFRSTINLFEVVGKIYVYFVGGK